jgi:hypothetical protein
MLAIPYSSALTLHFCFLFILKQFSSRSASASPALLSGDEDSPPASPQRFEQHSPFEKGAFWRENLPGTSASASARNASMLLRLGVRVAARLGELLGASWQPSLL